MAKPEDSAESHGRLSDDEAAQLMSHIAELTSAGLPLASGLRALAEEVRGRRLRSVLDRLADQLEAGTALETCIERLGDQLPPHLRGLIIAGSRTGKLGEVLVQFASYSNLGLDLRRSLWLRIAYPICVLIASFGVFVFVCVALVGSFSEIFRDFGLPLPKLTQIVVGVAGSVDRVWRQLARGGLLLGVVTVIAMLLLRHDDRRSLAWSIPLIGKVWRLSDLAEFARLLALLLEDQVPVVEALPMAGAAVRNNTVKSAAQQAAQEVARGQSLAQALTQPSLFPPGFLRILAWAETHRGLPDALRMVGEMFETRARTQANFASTACSILAFWSILGGIFVMLVAVFLPLFALLRALT